jgi:hypothetical protein
MMLPQFTHSFDGLDTPMPVQVDANIKPLLAQLACKGSTDIDMSNICRGKPAWLQ